MKTKVISGVVVAVILVLVWLGMFTPVFGLFFAVMAGMACYEITKVSGVECKTITYPAIAFAFVLPLMLEYGFKIPLVICIMIYIMGLLILMIFNHENVTFEKIAVTIYASVVVPFGFATLTLITDLYKIYKNIDERHCIFLIWFAVSSALFTDVFAYFIGMKFGKHKMAPKISPKKSMEGAVGGVICELLFNLLALFLFEKFVFNTPFAIPVWSYCIMSVFLSLMGIFGDLIASLIKRNCNVKDFSNLIPGHGGIMDRFDSVIFVAPMLYIMITLFELL